MHQAHKRLVQPTSCWSSSNCHSAVLAPPTMMMLFSPAQPPQSGPEYEVQQQRALFTVLAGSLIQWPQRARTGRDQCTPLGCSRMTAVPVGPSTCLNRSSWQPLARSCCASWSLNWSVPVCVDAAELSLRAMKPRRLSHAHAAVKKEVAHVSVYSGHIRAHQVMASAHAERSCRGSHMASLAAKHSGVAQLCRGSRLVGTLRQQQSKLSNSSEEPCSPSPLHESLDPALPPGKFSRERALIVSPAAGRRSTLSTRSMFMEPATTSGLALGLSPSAMSLAPRCACKKY